MSMCPHLGVLVYIPKTMASLHPRWLAGLSVFSSSSSWPTQLLWHQQFYKHKSLFVDPHSIASINPHISHTGPARRLCLFKLWGLAVFFFFLLKTNVLVPVGLNHTQYYGVTLYQGLFVLLHWRCVITGHTASHGTKGLKGRIFP